MAGALTGLLKIIIFLILGFGFKKGGLLKSSDIDGIKKIVLNLAIPSVLFLSFSRLEIDLGFIPIIAVIFGINLILYGMGLLFYKISGSKNRIIPLILSTMNFALIGIPLYEAVFGIENLHHYTMLGVGNEIFVWFVFFFLFRFFLSGGISEKGINKGFIKSPMVWAIILGCGFSIFHVNFAGTSNVLVSALYATLEAATKLTTPLILIYIGFFISIKRKHLFVSIRLVLLRLASAWGLGYLAKFLILDRFIEVSIEYNAAFFLLISLPAIFSLPILAADYLDEDEAAVLNNTIILHALVTIVLYAAYSLYIVL